jgi:hypothetical protein
MPVKKLKEKRNCIVRDRPCRRIFGGSSICFVASPSAEQVGLEIDVIKNVLKEEDIEAYVAVENFDPAKDIFCSKICAKIIESRLCVVILTGTGEGKTGNFPNPNVYYEYGLMNAWGKEIIPVQREGEQLAFNVRSLDTIKYAPETLRERFHRALRIVLSNIEQDSEEASERAGLEEMLDYYMELKDCSRLRGTVGMAKDIGFLAYRNWRFGVIVTGAETADRLYFSTRILFRRVERYMNKLEAELDEIRQKREDEAADGKTRDYLENIQKEKRLEIHKVRHLEILIVDSSGLKLGEDLVRKLRTIDSTLEPSIVLLSPEEIRGELGLG